MCLHLGKCMEAYVTFRHAKLGAHVMSLDVEGCIEAYVTSRHVKLGAHVTSLHLGVRGGRAWYVS